LFQQRVGLCQECPWLFSNALEKAKVVNEEEVLAAELLVVGLNLKEFT